MLRLGAHAEFEVTLTDELIEAFAGVSGDRNPIHLDEACAAVHAPHGQRIGHGMIAGAWLSRLIGMHLPGPGALYLSQTLRFHHPLDVGRTFRIRGQVIQAFEAMLVYKIHTTVEDVLRRQICVEGEALVKQMGTT